MVRTSSCVDRSSCQLLVDKQPVAIARSRGTARRTGKGLDVRRLSSELILAVRGEVLFDGASRAIYATDSSNYRQVPIGVVCPQDEADLVEALRICRDHGTPVLARGAGTSLAGQACNEAVVFDMSRHMNRILELDPVNRRARVQPGVILDDLRAAAEVHGLTFGPDPATHAWCTIGGMVGNNSCGTHALFAGKTVDNVERLTVITYDGHRFEVGPCDDAEFERVLEAGGEKARIYRELKELSERYGDQVRSRFPDIPRRVSGYNLDELLTGRGFNVARSLVGSESTCVFSTEVTVRLAPSPAIRRIVVVGFADIYQAADAVPHFLHHPLLGLEGFDDVLIRNMRASGVNLSELDHLPAGAGWLVAEVGGDDAQTADAHLRDLVADLPDGVTYIPYVDVDDQLAVWRIRDSALAASAIAPNGVHNHEGWEDAAVAPENLGAYLRGIRQLWDEFDYAGAWYGHFGQGCVHTRNNFDLSSVDGLAKFRAYVERAADLCVQLGGSLSGEHGDGQARGELLVKMFGPELINAFREFKAIWDPHARMNPGKLVDALPFDSNLRFGPTYKTSELRPSHFSFASDTGSLQIATERCVGVGRCRRDDTGVMCPSFRVTGDEQHSTRGRIKLLAEMFQGEVTPESWRNKEVREALDLCLSCKGCAFECPTQVDMATYKAEFLSHYFKRRLRPASAYALGLIPWVARVAARVPRFANVLLQSRVPGTVLKRLAGVSTKRSAPIFAKESFRQSEAARRRQHVTAPTVVLWPDTFSNAYEPGRVTATLALLEAAGETVVIPERWGCCGRPLFDFGMLDLARHSLQRVLDILEPWTSAGIPVVVPEPSCLSTFKDELPGLLSDDPRAQCLSELSRSLSERLLEIEWQPPSRSERRKVLMHPHCHQRASIGTSADQTVLERAGFDVEVLDAGCCGLAGSFGFRAEHDEMSREIAESKFLPALKGLDADTALVIDGFSCRTQADHLDARTGSSLAELLLGLAVTANSG
jgi:FAD/FMN-containing dehydrogenase/Fe-S oxidoreductase